MGNPGNGAQEPDQGQTAMNLDEESGTGPGDSPPDSARAPAMETTEEEPASDLPNPVTELANTKEGCWKTLEDGQRVELSETEWRKELTRLLAPHPKVPAA